LTPAGINPVLTITATSGTALTARLGLPPAPDGVTQFPWLCHALAIITYATVLRNLNAQ